MRYRIEFTRAASRQLAELQHDERRRVDEHVLALADTPRPSGAVKLTGRVDQYRIRVGRYRVVYEIHDEVLLILVIAVGHRREVYR